MCGGPFARGNGTSVRPGMETQVRIHSEYSQNTLRILSESESILRVLSEYSESILTHVSMHGRAPAPNRPAAHVFDVSRILSTRF